MKLLSSCLLFLVLNGCYCFQAEHAKEEGCVVLHQTIDCTTDAVKGMIPHLLPVALALIGGGSPNWDSLLVSLEAAGFKDAFCVLAQLQNDYLRHPAASGEAQIAARISEFMRKHHPDLKAKLPRPKS